ARAQEAVPFLQSHLKPSATKTDGQQILKLIAQLDDDDFTTRENAEAALIKLGRIVRVPVHAALGKTTSVEVRRRLEEVLKGLEKNDGPARIAQETRSLEVVENANTPAARKLLEMLASGTAEAELTVEAKAALDRLKKRVEQPD